MKTNNTQNLEQWLNKQIEVAKSIIEESQITKNYGRQTHYSGMLQAYIEMLNKLNVTNGVIG